MQNIQKLLAIITVYFEFETAKTFALKVIQYSLSSSIRKIIQNIFWSFLIMENIISKNQFGDKRCNFAINNVQNYPNCCYVS